MRITSIIALLLISVAGFGQRPRLADSTKGKIVETRLRKFARRAHMTFSNETVVLDTIKIPEGTTKQFIVDAHANGNGNKGYGQQMVVITNDHGKYKIGHKQVGHPYKGEGVVAKAQFDVVLVNNRVLVGIQGVDRVPMRWVYGLDDTEGKRNGETIADHPEILKRTSRRPKRNRDLFQVDSAGQLIHHKIIRHE